MTIKQRGGIFGRNPSFNDVTISGSVSLPNDSISGDAIDGGNAAVDTLLVGTAAETDLNDTGDAGVYVETGGRTKIAATGQEVMQINRSEADTSSRNIILFYRNGANVGKITGDGTSVAYVTSSDYRLKENVTAITGATDRLKQLNPVRFNFIADATKTVDGFLAHEVQSVVPEAITGTHNEVDDDGNPVYQGIDQSKLVPLLVKTIKELEARITALEAG